MRTNKGILAAIILAAVCIVGLAIAADETGTKTVTVNVNLSNGIINRGADNSVEICWNFAVTTAEGLTVPEVRKCGKVGRQLRDALAATAKTASLAVKAEFAQ